jgi:tripartite-type tricarboxylate transporter receptor subunit TctC
VVRFESFIQQETFVTLFAPARRASCVHVIAAAAMLWSCGAFGQGPSPASAQAYPARPLRIVVPFAPGGPNDILARLIGQKITESWGQQVIVDNRPGGATVIGTEIAAKSPPDGYTLLIVSPTTATNPSLMAKLPYDTLRDLAPVILLATSPNVLVVHPSLPAKSVRDLLAIAKRRPGEVTFASGGPGTSTHLAGEILALRGGVKMLHVPYKGAAPATIGLLSGEVSFQFGSILPLTPHIKAGRLRALAVSSPTRAPALPDVPPVAETLPGFDASPFHGIVVPSGTPREIILKLNHEIGRIMNLPETRQRLAVEGTEVRTGTPEEFDAYFRAEVDKWAKVIKEIGLRVQ